MNRLFIYEYIKRLHKDDIVRYSLNQGVRLMDYEIDIIYSYIKNDYKKIFSNPLDVLDEIKYKVSDLTYKKILELYDKYKDKIS